MQEVKSVDQYESIPELAVLLENFLQDEKVPWYIPDVTKEGDVAKLREKNLWKEFERLYEQQGQAKTVPAPRQSVLASPRLWKDKTIKYC